MADIDDDPQILYARERRLDAMADRSSTGANTDRWAAREIAKPATLAQTRREFRSRLDLIDELTGFDRDRLEALPLDQWCRVRLALYLVAAWAPVFADPDVQHLADIEEAA